VIKKLLSITLTLAFCLGLAISALAFKTVTHELLNTATLQAETDSLPQIYTYTDGKATSKLKMYPDAYGAGVIGFNIQTDSEEAVTITLTIVGADNVVFVIDRYEQYEIQMRGMVLSDDSRQLNISVVYSDYLFIHLDLAQYKAESLVMDFAFNVVFSYEGVELNRYENLINTVPNAEQAEEFDAAKKLHTLGLLRGMGNSADGMPYFALDRWPSRAEAITMFVRLLGKEKEALDGMWMTPLTDVPLLAEPYVGYAYAHGLTNGTSPTTFSGNEPATVSQYITFVLRSLGYSSESDFAWDRAWELSDELGITYPGEFSLTHDGTTYGSYYFTRGHIAIVSLAALGAADKETGKKLYELLIQNGAITREAAINAGLCEK